MNTLLLIATIGSSVLVLILGFLVLGTLRALGLVHWRLEQLELTRPSRIGRNGLSPGTKAPDFTLPSVAGNDVSLRDFLGRRLLLVFTQSGCRPCRDIAPELNRLHEQGQIVLVVNRGDAESARDWSEQSKARFPILTQEGFNLSKRYEAVVTPFAFLIDEQGVVRSKGIAGSRHYLNYVLSGAGNRATPECDSIVEREPIGSHSQREDSHV